MKLLFIYGSPAVGKLTVANEIARKTDFKVFHNHLSIDCVQPIFDFGTEPFFRLIEMIRLETVKEAALSNLNLIYTFCYAKDSDDAHVSKICETIEENGGEVCLVLLTAEKDELRKRVLEESRQSFGKVKNVAMMNFFFENYDLFSPVPERASFIIDNTYLSAEATARKIIGHFQIDEIEESN